MLKRILLLLCIVGLSMQTGWAQGFPTDEPVIKRIWEVGMDSSMTEQLAHELIDQIGPRIAGSEGLAQAQQWLLDYYGEWGVEARKEEYGTWNAWEQGVLHVDMLKPRIQTLEAEMLAWSPPTNGPVEAEVVMIPEGLDKAGVDAWLSTIKDKFVMMSPVEPMCRARQELEANGRPETVQRIDSLRRASRISWNRRLSGLGRFQEQFARVDSAGALAAFTSRWSGGWGVNKVFSAFTDTAAGIDLSCEDYGLLFRLIQNGVTPTLRVNAEAEHRGVIPQFNLIAEMKGTELPDEYVVLSAHLDSWHAATGATDNGTGTITMLEAMRILKKVYPNPKRTILVGHWGGEELGLMGSASFREDHPEIMEGLQALFNQDNGTWRFEKLEGQGFLASSKHLHQWMSVVPRYISEHVDVDTPGPQANRGSDHTSFVCAGAPAFRLQSPYDEYRQYTWHTNRDTYDKIVFDDLKENATLAAMMAYMASEDPEKVDRTKAQLPINSRTKKPMAWGPCREARRGPSR
ncbi:MAG: M28 family peptidase [Bacteroidota bacterium]